jgi:hypothetical protein
MITTAADFVIGITVRFFGYGHGVPQHTPVGSEWIGRFEVPQSAKGLRIEARYDADHPDASAGFGVWFGRRAEDVGLWEGRSEAVRATVSF